MHFILWKLKKIKQNIMETQGGMHTMTNESNCVTNKSYKHTEISVEEYSWFKEICKIAFWLDAVRLKIKINCTLVSAFNSHRTMVSNSKINNICILGWTNK